METVSNLDRLKHGFNSLVSQADYISMYDFMNWLDQKLCEYKHTGHLVNRDLQNTGNVKSRLPYQLPIFSRALPTINKSISSAPCQSVAAMNPIQLSVLNYSLNRPPKLPPYLPNPPTQFSRFNDSEYPTLNLCKDVKPLKKELANKSYEPFNPLIIDLPNDSSSSSPDTKHPSNITDTQPSSSSEPPFSSMSPSLDNSSNSPTSVNSFQSINSKPTPTIPSPSKSNLTNSPKSNDSNKTKETSTKKGKSSPIGADCPHCGKHLRYRSSFHRHMRIHAGLYSHECSTCERKFTRREHFQRHNCQRKSIKRSILPVITDKDHTNAPIVDQSSDSLTDSVSQTIDEVAKSVSVDSSDYHSGTSYTSRRKKSAPRRIVEAEKVFSDSDNDTSTTSKIVTSSKPIKIEETNPVKDNISIIYNNSEPQTQEVNNKAEDLSINFSSFKNETKYEVEKVIKNEKIRSCQNTIDKLKLETGDYKVSHGAEQSFIKVVKQGNYLKLRREAQLIGDKLCFVCPHCSKVFHRSSNFSRHMRIHRGVYSYVCPTCQRGFFRKEHFQKHKCYRKGMSITYDRKTKMSQMENKSIALI